MMKDWYVMDRVERIERIKTLCLEGSSTKQIGTLFGCPAKTIQTFMRIWKIKGLSRGAQPNNKNAMLHDQSLNANRKRMRDAVISTGRSLYICEKCGWEDGRKWPIHHKDRNKDNNDPNNLKVLCNGCHAEEHVDERTRGENGTFA